MIYQIHRPDFPLSQFIDHLFYYEDHLATHRMEKLLPDGSVDLLIDLTEGSKKLFHDESGANYSSFKKSWISGMKTDFILIDASVSRMLGVHFKPGGCYPFFDFKMEELNNLTVELDLVWGAEVNILREAILDEPCPEKMFLFLEKFLLYKAKNKIENHLLVDYAVSQLIHAPHMWTIQKLAARTGVTQKHLITLFKKYVGLSPKVFSRIQKFQKVLTLVEKQEKIEWASLAYECGYFDQAHFIKEFQAFSGINPVSYLEKRGPYLNYLPIA